jgi:hypothetical protein
MVTTISHSDKDFGYVTKYEAIKFHVIGFINDHTPNVNFSTEIEEEKYFTVSFSATLQDFL